MKLDAHFQDKVAYLDKLSNLKEWKLFQRKL